MKKQTKEVYIWGLSLIVTLFWFFFGFPTLMNGSGLSILAALVISVLVILGVIPNLINKFDSLKNTVKGRFN